jgi:putative Mg2+ transporter-C (MgtC) family protein
MINYLMETLDQLYIFLPMGFLFRIILAAFLGAIIGLEREWSDKPAGLRTNTLICVGAALFTEISLRIGEGYIDFEFANADAARVAAQVVSGIGFLGAGTIIQSRGSVIGLTTAATMWVVAAIGMATGIQAYMFAIGTTILVLLALIPLRKAENLFINQSTYWFQLDISDNENLLEKVENIIDEIGINVIRTSIKRKQDEQIMEINYDTNGPKSKFDKLQTRLIENSGVYGIKINKK